MKKTKVLSFAALLAALTCALAVVMTACGGGVKISLSQQELNLTVGGTGTVVATVDGSDEAAKWSIDDDSVATIAVVGKLCTVKALKVGTAKITAAVGDAKAVCNVNVTASNVETVTVTLDGQAVSSLSVGMKESKTLVATSSKGSAVTWESSNEKIATVNNGVVTGVRSGTATITAKVTASIKAEIEVTVTGDYVYYEMEATGAAGALDKPDYWTYYGEWAVNPETDPVPEYDNGKINLKFSNNTGAWYAMQLFYKQTDLKENQLYKLTFDLDTTKGGKITVNGQQITLKDGKNSIEIYYTERFIAYSGADSYPISLVIIFGVEGQANSDIDAATVTIDNMVWTEYTPVKLETPSFTLAEADGVYTITITDTNDAANVGGYKLNFYDASGNLQGSTAVKNGEAVNCKSVKNGTYTVKLVAEAATKKHTNSDEATTQNNTIVVENAKTDIGNYNNGGQDYAVANPGTWVYWADQNWCGSTVTVSECYMDADSAIHLTYTSVGSCTFGMQLFYKDSTLTSGSEYTLTMKVNSTVAGTITVNNVEKELAVGDNEISVTFTEGAGASISIQFGANMTGGAMITGGTFVLGEIAIAPKAE